MADWGLCPMIDKQFYSRDEKKSSMHPGKNQSSPSWIIKLVKAGYPTGYETESSWIQNQFHNADPARPTFN